MQRGLPGIRHRLEVAVNSYRRFTARFVPAIRLGSVIVGVAAFIGAIACLTALTIYFGLTIQKATCDASQGCCACVSSYS